MCPRLFGENQKIARYGFVRKAMVRLRTVWERIPVGNCKRYSVASSPMSQWPSQLRRLALLRLGRSSFWERLYGALGGGKDSNDETKLKLVMSLRTEI